MTGRARRLKRLFKDDGRAILTPIDHGLWYGPMRGIEVPVEITRKVIAGSDGLLISPGFARSVMIVLPSDRALVIRVGTSTSLSRVQDYESIFAGVETALRLDADALAHTLYLGGENDERGLSDLGQLIESSSAYDVPVIAEFLPTHDDWTGEQVALWARLGFELGADVIKTVYTGDPESFSRVVSGCPLPILIAGGPNTGSLEDLLRTVAGAIQAGASGTAIGRRVWQAENPGFVLDLFAKLIHGSTGLQKVLEGAAAH